MHFRDHENKYDGPRTAFPVCRLRHNGAIVLLSPSKISVQLLEEQELHTLPVQLRAVPIADTSDRKDFHAEVRSKYLFFEVTMPQAYLI